MSSVVGGSPGDESGGDGGGDSEPLEEPVTGCFKYLGPLKALLGWKRKKKVHTKDWKTLRNERIAEERAKEEEDERLKLEKREEDRKRQEAEGDNSDDESQATEGDSLKKKGKRGKRGGEDDKDEDDGNDEIKTPAARILTKIVRGFVARRKYKRKFKAALEANEAYYGGVVKEKRARKMAISNRRAGLEAAKIFVRQYVVDLVDTSALFLVQTTAAITIQKNYRGARTRKKLAMKPAERPKKAPPTRFTPQTLRRVWARSEYAPKGGWPGRASLVVEYDFREYKDRPPKGSSFGIKTPKVHANVQDQEEMDILTTNEFSWVGLPIMVEPEVVARRKKVRRKQDLMLMEGTSPFVGPQFVSPVIPPAPAQKGIKAVKGLGWTQDMIDRRKEFDSDAKRGYHIIDPYSSAALAADLATIVKNDDFTFTKSPSKLSERERSSYGVRLGSSLEDQSVVSMSSMESSRAQRSVATNASNNTKGRGSQQDKKIGIGVWGGDLSGHDVVPASSELQARKKRTGVSDSHFTSDTAQVVQLVTPTRGYAKPLTSHKAKALAQAGLMPEQLEERLELETTRVLMDHSKTSIFEAHGKDKRLEKLRQKEIVKQKHMGFIKGHSDQKLMESDRNWEKSVKYRLIEGANKMAEEMLGEDQPEALDEDPWSRSTFKPKEKITGKSVVWKKKPAEYYSYKYQWLPQPMLKQAVLDVYPDSRAPRHVREKAFEESSLVSGAASIGSSSDRKSSRSSDASAKKGGGTGRNAKIMPSDKKARVKHPYSFSP